MRRIDRLADRLARWAKRHPILAQCLVTAILLSPLVLSMSITTCFLHGVQVG